MLWLPPLDHFGRPIPVPAHHLFTWRSQGIQLLLGFLGYTALMFAVMLGLAAFKIRDLGTLIRTAPEAAVISASVSVLIAFLLAAIPPITWPWTRRDYGRLLEARVEQMSTFELNLQIEECDRELESAASARRRTALVAWRNWLEAKRVARAAEVTPQRQERLTLRPARRKLIVSVACGAPLLAVGLWIVLLAIVGGDGGTGIEGFSGPNAVWTKSIIGGLVVLVTAIPLLEAFTVRVDLTAIELRKRGWGRTLWSIPRENVLFMLGDNDSWEVLDAATQKRIGELNPHHFEDGELVELIGLLRPIG